MATRRARAAAAAEQPPPPPPEPTPEPEPEPTEAEKTPEKPSLVEEAATEQALKDVGGEKIRERIIERIIICPGGQDPYYSPPAPQCHCPPPPPPAKKKGKKGKGKKGKAEDDGLCNHPFCIVQRARVKPQGLPWASGLYNGPAPPPAPATGGAPQPPILVCQRPVVCCCPHCRPLPSSDSESDAEPEPEPALADTQQFMTFMNMVFAASNVINERPDAF